ncbi:hypothetical protein [Tuwongella immobilis]|uniref:Uncharacterized protein n=1 Tax=Tuwongella immobilis TaxID=692036 RepID=A0A6C2YUY6_9BACT|nr:hypothetical protein [Tuwongella immobilis]VIP05548.1 unnamed protein product [Tuwongella immobilis]VTS08452.1 unnamed protein product [Tuwongella immobilis]
MSTPSEIRLPTKRLDPTLVELLRSLVPGDRIEIVKIVRVGSREWETKPIQATFRHLNYLATGLATDRVPEDDLIVPMVHFTKDNQELSSISIDERTKVRKLEAAK